MTILKVARMLGWLRFSVSAASAGTGVLPKPLWHTQSDFFTSCT